MAARPNFEIVLILLIFSQSVLCAEKSSKTVNDGLIDTLTTGVKFAKDFLGEYILNTCTFIGKPEIMCFDSCFNHCE